MEFLLEAEKLNDVLHGFLPMRSWSIQLLSALEDWTRELENGESVDITDLDTDDRSAQLQLDLSAANCSVTRPGFSLSTLRNASFFASEEATHGVGKH